MNATSFYHVFADGDWEEAAGEFAWALERSGFNGERCAGLVGSAENRARARRVLAGWTIKTEAERGHEQVTLRALHDWAKAADPDAAVLYVHTKGGLYSARSSRAKHWRHAMMHETVMAWEQAAGHIPEFDAAGAGWQEPPNNFFFGNFWWARAGYLAELAPVSDETRYHAEWWLGSGGPRVKDLCPNFVRKYDLGWNYYTRMFNQGYDCRECS